jgi:hypothetical protein
VATPSPLSQNIAFVVCASHTTTHSPCSPPSILTHIAAHGSCALQGNDAPAPIRNFGELGALGLAPRAVQQVQSFGFAEPSPIQVSDETVVARPIPSRRSRRWSWPDLHVVIPTRGHTHTHTHTHTHHTHTHTITSFSPFSPCYFSTALLLSCYAAHSHVTLTGNFAPRHSHACHHSHNNDFTITH